jgi:hypothetical protein
MDNNEVAAMTGQAGAEKVAAYKLNEIRMSGDDGKFIVVGLLQEKAEDGKYPSKEMGAVVEGVILKMRWRLSKYEETDGENGRYITSSEFDNKNTDKVVVFSTGEKGLAIDIKEKYGLGTQRVIYALVSKQIVRIHVKASALSGDKNPEKQMGLFEYVDSHNDTGTFLHEFITQFASVHRQDPKGNKRKDYFAMTFRCGRALNDEEKAMVVEKIKEVHSKTSEAKNFADDYVAPVAPVAQAEEINVDDIPF